MKHFESRWESFKKVIPPDAGEIQHQEMKRAFYGGGVALFSMMIDAMYPKGRELSDEEGLLFLKEIDAEFKAYAFQLMMEALTYEKKSS